MKNTLRLATAVATGLMLSGCFSFGEKPPASLMTLSAAPAPQPGTTRIDRGGAITVEVPDAPQEIGVLRVPVRASDTSVAYVKDTRWVEPPARLFARLLGDTITTRTGRLVADPGSLATPGAILGGQLRSFGIDAATSSAVVTYDAALTRSGGNRGLEQRRFEARVPVPIVDATTVGPALNQAANQVAAEVADWVGR